MYLHKFCLGLDGQEEVNCELHPYGEAVYQSRESRCAGPGASTVCLRTKGRQKGVDGVNGERVEEGNSLRGCEEECGLEGHHHKTLRGIFKQRRVQTLVLESRSRA